MLFFGPIITEKTMKMMAEDNKVTFEVAKGANKVLVRQAVEALFKVDVEKVNMQNYKAKKQNVLEDTQKNECCA